MGTSRYFPFQVKLQGRETSLQGVLPHKLAVLFWQGQPLGEAANSPYWARK